MSTVITNNNNLDDLLSEVNQTIKEYSNSMNNLITSNENQSADLTEHFVKYAGLPQDIYTYYDSKLTQASEEEKIMAVESHINFETEDLAMHTVEEIEEKITQLETQNTFMMELLKRLKLNPNCQNLDRLCEKSKACENLKNSLHHIDFLEKLISLNEKHKFILQKTIENCEENNTDNFVDEEETLKLRIEEVEDLVGPLKYEEFATEFDEI